MKYVIKNINKCSMEESYHYPYLEKWYQEKSTIYKDNTLEWIEKIGANKSQVDRVLEKLYENMITKTPLWEEVVTSYKEHFKELVTKFKKLPSLDAFALVSPFLHYYREQFDYAKKVGSENYALISQDYAHKMLQNMIKVHIVELSEYADKIGYQPNKETTEEEYQKFLWSYLENSEELIELFEKYPILIDQMLQTTKNHIEFLMSFYTECSQHFEDISKIKLLSIGDGDTHQKGKSVISFAYKQKVYFYKPKDNRVERLYYSIINVINNNSNFDFYVPQDVIYNENYTIDPKVEHLEVNSVGEFKDYYHDLGGLLCLIYALNGNDIHFENIIARGKQPVIIDLETIIQANFEFFEEPLKEIMNKSLYKLSTIGILSLKLESQSNEIDISALAGDACNLKNQFLLKNLNTMELTFEDSETIMNGANNHPMFNGEKANYKDYVDEFITGFEDMINAIEENYNQIYNILDTTKNYRVRNVLRATFNYARFLSYSNHPVYLSNYVRHDKFYENMMNYPFKDKNINISEAQDLSEGDIPVFFSYINDKHLYDSTGKKLENLYSKTPIAHAKEKLNYVIENQEALYFDLIISLLGDREKIYEYSTNNEAKVTLEEILDTLTTKLNQKLCLDTIYNSNGTYMYDEYNMSLHGGLTSIWLLMWMIKKAGYNTKVNPQQVMKNIMSKIELLDVGMYTQYNLTEKDIILLYYINMIEYLETNNDFYKVNARLIKDTYLSTSSCDLEATIINELKYITNSTIDKNGEIVIAPKECIILKNTLSYGFRDGVLGVAIKLINEQYHLLSEIEKSIKKEVFA